MLAVFTLHVLQIEITMLSRKKLGEEKLNYVCEFFLYSCGKTTTVRRRRP